MLSKTAISTVAALAMLAERPPGTCMGAAEIAREVNAPQNYLGKLLKQMAELGILASQKGKGGGFRFARDPKRITLYEVVDAIDRVSRWNGCFLGLARCSHDAPCPVHDRWSKVRDEYLSFLKEVTIADLTQKPFWDRLVS